MTSPRSARTVVLLAAVTLQLAGCSSSSGTAPAPVDRSASASASARPTSVDGIYRADIPADDFLRAGVGQTAAQENSGVITLTLKQGTLRIEYLEGGSPCTGSYRLDGARFLLTLTPGECSGDGAMTWSADGAGLRFTDFTPTDPALDDPVDRVFWTGRTWQRVG